MKHRSPLRGEIDNGIGTMAIHEDHTTESSDQTATGARNWIAAHKLRTAIMAACTLAALTVLFAVWSYVGHVAVIDSDIVTLDMALEALDEEKYDEARNLVNRLQRQPGAADYGSSLFVLGAVKAHQADTEWSVERRRATHLVAARYLEKASEMGVPLERQKQLQYLLGRSLICGNHAGVGIAVLQSALEGIDHPPTEIRRLLTEAYINLPDPDLHSALANNDAMLTDEYLSPGGRNDAVLLRIEILIRLGHWDEAEKLLTTWDDDNSQPARRKLLQGEIKLAKAREAFGDDDVAALIEGALSDLREAERLDNRKGEVARQAMVMIGQCYELRGDAMSAIEQFESVSNRYGDSPEAILATISKARLAQQAGDSEKALIGYRAVLESVGSPQTYMNPLMSLSQLRRELLTAQAGFTKTGQFEEAMGLTEHFPGLFGPMIVTQLKAETHVAWGDSCHAEAADASRYSIQESLKSVGRYHYRAAGRAYQTLADLRYATRDYIDDLWAAAENYFRGQSYTHTALVLDDYLHYEARMRRAIALLRYGQSKLAIGKVQEAIDALQECIEMHPTDPHIYTARVECAKAYLIAGKPSKAEQLLIANLASETLTPASIDWRDSLFLLGDQLHEARKYHEAIAKLEEAVARYPDAPQTLLARYTIARAFHSAAEEPAQKAREAKTENERQKNRRLRDDNLKAALDTYMAVQRDITIQGRNVESELTKILLRNCYMMQGTVLFQLRRYEEARKAYANVSTLYQHDPFVLESFVHIAHCWHRLNQPLNARQTIAQAKLVLDRLPADADFQLSTNFSRQQWDLLLDEMADW